MKNIIELIKSRIKFAKAREYMTAEEILNETSEMLEENGFSVYEVYSKAFYANDINVVTKLFTSEEKANEYVDEETKRLLDANKKCEMFESDGVVHLVNSKNEKLVYTFEISEKAVN